MQRPGGRVGARYALDREELAVGQPDQQVRVTVRIGCPRPADRTHRRGQAERSEHAKIETEHVRRHMRDKIRCLPVPPTQIAQSGQYLRRGG